MKKISPLFKFFILLLVSIFIFSFSAVKKQQDPRLIGIWKGFEKDRQIEGVEKHWIQQRFQNGTYVIMFTTKENCEVETFTESGEWWTEDGKFYEVSEGTKDIDVYNYDVKNEEVVDFKSIRLLGEDSDTYVFSDYKLDL